jgi:hypothetical protein
MVKKSLFAICSVALLAAAFALPASAQDSERTTPLVAHATYTHISPWTQEPPVPFTIFSDFGNPAATNSWAGTGYYILGPTNPLGDPQQSFAVAFIPTAASHVTKIEVPVQCNVFSGTVCTAGNNGFEQSLQADCAGVPCGVPIAGTAYKAQLANTVFYTCCTAADAKSQTFGGGGIALAAGTQYWVVVDANPAADTNTENVWDDGGGPTLGYQLGGSTTAWGSFNGAGASGAKVTGTKP